MTERFAGTDRYIATDDLMMAVNAAVTLGRRCSSRGSPAQARRSSPRRLPARWKDDV